MLFFSLGKNVQFKYFESVSFSFIDFVTTLTYSYVVFRLVLLNQGTSHMYKAFRIILLFPEPKWPNQMQQDIDRNSHLAMRVSK